MSIPGHNLDIHTYGLTEIMELFEIRDIYQVSLDDLKRAKKKVLMLHPDKSKLSKEYFLFYKKAFDIIVRMYENVQKVSQPVEDRDYHANGDYESQNQFQKKLKGIPQNTFQDQFNTMFDKHMKTPINTQKNAWFHEETLLYEESITSAGQMNEVLDKIKHRQSTLIQYKGIQPVQMMNSGSNSFYENDDEDENSVSYIGSDIFSKLKYDDLRKVHKDQTVFCVRDSDMENVPQYRTVEDYNRARDVQHIKPIERSGAQQMIEEQERILQERVRYQQYHSELSTMKYAEANKQVMASFLRLQN